jgi:CRISPR system Cascade subunit CasA
MKFFRESTDRLAAQAKKRVGEVGTLRGKVLRPALFSLLQQGPEDINYGANTTAAQAEKYRFEQRVDATFFSDLWDEAEAEADGEQQRIRHEWRQALAFAALALLDDAARSAPQAAMRRYRAKVRARGLFFGLLHKHFPDLKREETHDSAA